MMIDGKPTGLRRFALSVLMIWATAGVAAADTATGIAAFKRTNYATALKELAEPVREGDPDALYTVAIIHGAGLGVTRDLARAAALYRRAAEANHTNAQYELGTALVLGDGVAQDIAEAVKWLIIAGRSGHKTAKVSVEQVLKYRSRNFIRDVQRAARDWMKSFNAASRQGN